MLNDMNELSGCGIKDDDVPEEVNILSLKELIDISHH